MEVLVEIWGPNLPRSLQNIATLHVHKSGCKDTTRGAYRHVTEREWRMLATSVDDIVQTIYPPEDFEYDPEGEEYAMYLSDVKIYPCVTKHWE